MILWSRLRRSRGFGIHSPFAFDLVLRTLRECAPYYAYADLDRLRREATDSREGHGRVPSAADLRLLVRLVARFRPRRVLVSDDPTGLLAAAVTLADDRITLGHGDEPADMVILTGRGDTPAAVDAARDAVMRGGVALLLDRRHSPDAARHITDPMRRGMTFTSRHKLLAVGDPRLPRQNFDILF